MTIKKKNYLTYHDKYTYPYDSLVHKIRMRKKKYMLSRINVLDLINLHICLKFS